MALTILEMAKIQSDELIQGVLEIMAKTSPVLRVLPFMDPIKEGSFSYNVEKALPDVGFRGINENPSQGKSLILPKTETLAILSADVKADVQLIKRYGSAYISGESRRNIKAMAYAFTKAFFNGDSGVNPKEPDGLRKRLAGEQVIEAGTNGGELSLDLMDELIDLTEELPDALYMNKAMRRKLLSLARGTNILQETRDEFGRPIQTYAGVPILVVDKDGQGNPILDFNEVQGTANNTTSIYAVKFGDWEYVAGLRDGDPDVRDLGESTEGPYRVVRIEWSIGFAVFSPYAAGRLKGLLPPA